MMTAEEKGREDNLKTNWKRGYLLTKFASSIIYKGGRVEVGTKEYLGDSVYAEYLGDGVRLYLDNGMGAHTEIFMEGSVIAALQLFVKQAQEPI